MNNDDVILFFAKWIENETGIVYEEHNFYQLKDRLDQMAKLFSLSSIQDLKKKAQTEMNSVFRQQLIDISTNNETSFFRDPKFFQSVKNKVIPELVSEAGGFSKLKIWSVASSNGQEPYSLAMIILELAKKLGQSPAQILATDICERVLQKARSGKYSEIEVNRGLSNELKNTYFRVDTNNNWIVGPEIRTMVEFKQLNLRESFSFQAKFDLVLCRNILIYQRVDAKKAIIKKLTEVLRPGGVLLLGSGESLIGLSGDYNQELVDGVAVYRKKKLEALAA
jgi:chemotaxis protein methyltransferase CheR